jgi:hypothetical protein
MKGVAKTLGLAPKAPYVAPATTETVPLAPVETATLREMAPLSVAPPEKSAEEIRKPQRMPRGRLTRIRPWRRIGCGRSGQRWRLGFAGGGRCCRARARSAFAPRWAARDGKFARQAVHGAVSAREGPARHVPDSGG